MLFGGLQTLILSSAGAENCSQVDLSNEMGPIRSQGDIGWCYANAAADLLSHRYRQDLRGQQVSALYTALLFNQEFYDETLVSKVTPKNLFEGGSVYLAMREAITSGFCPRTEDDSFVAGGLRLTLKQKLLVGVRLKSLYDKRDRAGFQTTLAKIRHTNSILNKISNSRLTQLLQISTPQNFLKNVADELCVGAKFVPADKASSWFSVAPPRNNLNFRLFNAIDDQLDRRNPVGVSYYMTFFEGWDKVPNRADKHASVIVGREMRNGQCHYKLRNSWGSGCNYKNPKFKQGIDCDRGHLWIPKSEYRRYLFGVTYLQPEGSSRLRNVYNSTVGSFD